MDRVVRGARARTGTARPTTIGEHVLERSYGIGSTGTLRLVCHDVTSELIAIKVIKKALFKNHLELLKKGSAKSC
jgi:hypothetical protein